MKINFFKVFLFYNSFCHIFAENKNYNDMEKIKKFFYNQHDVECNQKYGDNLPYSFHLKAVEAQGSKFLQLVKDSTVSNPMNYRSESTSIHSVLKVAMIAHDSLEDARLSYNDVLRVTTDFFENSVAGKLVADIVYCVTDEKGKIRGERKNDKYYNELSLNKLAVFVKLADIAANTLFSKLTSNSMYDKYKNEFPNFRERCFVAEYEEFFNYVENL